ncbi:hypothetical protein [Amycolatopsis rubida]|uniref:Uncharacterized protein n=1 Tax=Amycolatopsis rubida TaxID=112413 RepID=A0A1I5E4Z5_9PSEU|nr:hypothetical protein [Amycolatopsis rubida]SFO06330.1 hypothetical protein SAMN05421854_101490 [Amycolatopsis rubida]
MDDINIADLAAQAAAAVGGYLAAIAGKVADKVKDGAAARLYGLIEPRLTGTASGAAALDKLREAPHAQDRRQMVAAGLQDIRDRRPGVRRAARPSGPRQGRGVRANTGSGSKFVTAGAW